MSQRSSFRVAGDGADPAAVAHHPPSSEGRQVLLSSHGRIGLGRLTSSPQPPPLPTSPAQTLPNPPLSTSLSLPQSPIPPLTPITPASGGSGDSHPHQPPSRAPQRYSVSDGGSYPSFSFNGSTLHSLHSGVGISAAGGGSPVEGTPAAQRAKEEALVEHHHHHHHHHHRHHHLHEGIDGPAKQSPLSAKTSPTQYLSPVSVFSPLSVGAHSSPRISFQSVNPQTSHSTVTTSTAPGNSNSRLVFQIQEDKAAAMMSSLLLLHDEKLREQHSQMRRSHQSHEIVEEEDEKDVLSSSETIEKSDFGTELFFNYQMLLLFCSLLLIANVAVVFVMSVWVMMPQLHHESRVRCKYVGIGSCVIAVAIHVTASISLTLRYRRWTRAVSRKMKEVIDFFHRIGTFHLHESAVYADGFQDFSTLFPGHQPMHLVRYSTWIEEQQAEEAMSLACICLRLLTAETAAARLAAVAVALPRGAPLTAMASSVDERSDVDGDSHLLPVVISEPFLETPSMEAGGVVVGTSIGGGGGDGPGDAGVGSGLTPGSSGLWRRDSQEWSGAEFNRDGFLAAGPGGPPDMMEVFCASSLAREPPILTQNASVDIPSGNDVLRAYGKEQPLTLRDVSVLVASFSGFFDALTFDPTYIRQVSRLFIGIVVKYAHRYGGLAVVTRPDRVMIIWNTQGLPCPHDHRTLALRCGRSLTSALGTLKMSRDAPEPVLVGLNPVLLAFAGTYLVGTIGSSQLERRLIVSGRTVNTAMTVLTLLHLLSQQHQSLETSTTFSAMAAERQGPLSNTATTIGSNATVVATNSAASPTTTMTSSFFSSSSSNHRHLSSSDRLNQRGVAATSSSASMSPTAPPSSVPVYFTWMGSTTPPTTSQVPFDLVTDTESKKPQRWTLFHIFHNERLLPAQERGVDIMRQAFTAFTTGNHIAAMERYEEAEKYFPRFAILQQLKQLAAYFAREVGPPYARPTPHWKKFEGSQGRREKKGSLQLLAASATTPRASANQHPSTPEVSIDENCAPSPLSMNAPGLLCVLNPLGVLESPRNASHTREGAVSNGGSAAANTAALPGDGAKQSKRPQSLLPPDAPPFSPLVSEGKRHKGGGHRSADGTPSSTSTASASSPLGAGGSRGPMSSVFSPVKSNQQPPPLLSTDITDRQGLKYRLSQRVLGRGAMGEVRLGLSHTGGLVAVKVVDLVVKAPPAAAPLTARAEAMQRRRLRRKGIQGNDDEASHTIQSLTSEIEMLSRLRHRCIVGYIGALSDAKTLMLIMEYTSGGSLQKMLGMFDNLSSEQAVGYLRDVLHGLVYLHSQSIVHRDVKPENVLVTVSGGCKLIDFGISKQVSFAAREAIVSGTPWYMSPEAQRGDTTAKSDIWSFGVMVVQVLTRRLPWPNNATPISIGYNLCKDPTYRPSVQGDTVLSKDALDVFNLCTQRNPDDRPTAHSLLQHSFFKQSTHRRG